MIQRRSPYKTRSDKGKPRKDNAWSRTKAKMAALEEENARLRAEQQPVLAINARTNLGSIVDFLRVELARDINARFFIFRIKD